MSQPNNALIRFRLDETDDTGRQQLVKGKGRKRETLGGSKHKLVHAARYGYSSHAPKGSQGLATALNGNPDQMFVIHVEHPDHRPQNLAEGEVKIYDKNGQYVHLKANGHTVIYGGGATITMKDGKIILDGIVYLGGEDAIKEVAMRGSTDDDTEANGADALVGNLATRALVK